MADPVDTGTREPSLRRPVARAQQSYSGRFRIAYVALTLLFWAVVGVGTVLVTNVDWGRDYGDWSSWRPAAQGLTGAQQVASRVAPQYRSDDGTTQLAVVRAELASAPQFAGFQFQNASPPENVPARKTVFYRFCGFGRSCSMAGQSTAARLRLTKREALELSLYTLKYLHGVDAVVSILPPPPNRLDRNWAIVVRKDDLRDELERPLRATLASPPPLTPETLGTTEAGTIEQLTLPHFFDFEVQQTGTGALAFVLQPVNG